jgi:hypothetical protein
MQYKLHLHVSLSLRVAVGTEACKKRSEKSPSQKERLSESTLRPYARLIGVTMAQNNTCERMSSLHGARFDHLEWKTA